MPGIASVAVIETSPTISPVAGFTDFSVAICVLSGVPLAVSYAHERGEGPGDEPGMIGNPGPSVKGVEAAA